MKMSLTDFRIKTHWRIPPICVVVFLLTTLMSGCSSQQDAHKYSLNDLYALGLTEQAALSIYPTRGGLTAQPIVCSAADLQSFMRLEIALTQAAAAPEAERNAVPLLYRTMHFSGPAVDDYIVGELDGRAYVQRPDGVVCALPDSEYKFILDFCGIVLPYPEELDQRELLAAVMAMTALYHNGNIPSGAGFDTYLPQNVNFEIPVVQTVGDFYITDAMPYAVSDITPPEGQYIAVVPCGYYYELQMGMFFENGQWQVHGVRVARSNLRMMWDNPNEESRLVLFGPSITDISGWGMHQLSRLELFNVKTSEVLWQIDGICFIGGGAWSEDGRYFAFSHEVGRAQNRVLQTMLLDTADMSAITLTPPDARSDSKLEVREWKNNTELSLICTPRGQGSSALLYDTVSHLMTADR